jgi:hypothetical protein
MKNKIYQTLNFLHNASKSKIVPTIRDACQFETNIHHFWLAEKYNTILEVLQRMEKRIGSEVWKYKGRFGYSTEQLYVADIMNRTEDTPVIFTQELYEKFEVDYLAYIVEGLSNEVLIQSPVLRSTSMFSNLISLVELEAKQVLIKELKKILSDAT